MEEISAYEHERHSVAASIAVLTFDTDGLRVSDLMSAFTLDQLIEKRDELLQSIDEEVALQGFYEVKPWVDATWLATQLQTEFGSYVDAGEHMGVKAIVIVPHYKI